MQGTQSVARALGLLRLFSPSQAAWSLKELTAASGLSPSTAHRLIQALVANEFLSVEPGGRRYTAGPAVFDIAGSIYAPQRLGDVYGLSLPYMERLREISRETVGIHRRSGIYRIAVAELESPQVIRLGLRSGRVRLIYTGAAGKIFMSSLTEVEVESVLEVAERNGYHRDRAEFLDGLATIAEQGFAISEGETTAGANSIAAGVVAPSGEIAAAISISGPDQRWTRRAMGAVRDDLVASVREISALLAPGSAVDVGTNRPSEP